jgi:uncharacterized C2H2 Zn-finger protein
MYIVDVYPSPSATSSVSPTNSDLEQKEAAESIDGKKKDGLGEYPCPFVGCGKVFQRNHNLKSHMLIHTDEKPFVCNQCHMAFRRNHDLRRHYRLHSGVKPYACPRCDKRFSRSDALRRHLKVEACVNQMVMHPGLSRRASMSSVPSASDNYYANEWNGYSNPGEVYSNSLSINTSWPSSDATPHRSDSNAMMFHPTAIPQDNYSSSYPSNGNALISPPMSTMGSGGQGLYGAQHEYSSSENNPLSSPLYSNHMAHVQYGPHE